MNSFILVVRSFRQLLSAFLLSVFCLHPVWADDTEIFFSPVSGAEAQPNIVLLLDATVSMLRYDCANNSPFSPCTDGTEFGNLTRLDRMNNAMTEILNTARNVNIGVMRMSNTEGGAKVIYPVRDIEQTLCDGVPCQDASDFS